MKIYSIGKVWLPFRYLYLIGMYLSCSNAFANTPKSFSLFQQQPEHVTGTITDSRGALPGVTINVKGKSTVSITDHNGRYSIAASPTDSLVYSFVGYKTVTVPVNGRAVIDTVLEEDATSLQEVTVNAGYYKVKDRERTGSISRITSKDIGNQPVSNVLASMQGRMPGVNIVQSTGSPGGGFDIQIRGRNSLRAGASGPLYIVDGVPYSSDAIGTSNTSAVLPGSSNPLNNLNPEQIESIEVLKDADATAIYGSRGANGVVLVTTKKGKSGKTNYAAGYFNGFGEVAHFIRMMKTPEYLEMRDQAYLNDNITTYPSNAYDVNGIWDRDRYTNWQQKLLGGMADFTSAQVSVSGGSEQTQFHIAVGYNSQGTVTPEDFEYKKGNVRANISHKSADGNFTMDFTGAYTVQDNHLPTTDFTHESRSLAPNAPALFDESGNLNWEGGTFNNPLVQMRSEHRARTNDLISNMVVGFRILPYLLLRSNLGYTHLNHHETMAVPLNTDNPNYVPGVGSPSLNQTETGRRSWIVEPQLEYKKDSRDFEVSVLAGASFQQLNGNTFTLRATGFSGNSLIYNIGSAATLSTLSSVETEYRYHAVYARANVQYKNRYILNLTGRRDGSSRFGPGQRFSNFGAIGAAWIFSDEGLLQNSKVFSFGKLRGSYGLTGSDQIGDYQFIDTYTSTGISYNGIVGLAPTRLYNPNFGWESNRKTELALEAGFFNDRIFFTTAWYRNSSSSQLVGIPLPTTTGFNSVQANLGAEVENSGWELSLRTVNLRGGKFQWTTNINLSIPRNELVSFPGLEGSTYASQFVIGQPTSIRKLYKLTGVDPQTGRYTFFDYNGDDAITSADRQYVSDLTPQYFGGVQNTFDYGGFTLDFLFQFVRQQNYSPAYFSGPPGFASNQPAGLAEDWRTPGDIAPVQVLTTGLNGTALSAFDRYLNSDAVITDASFVRLKNLSVSYRLPQQLTGSLNCRISLQGQNLLTFTKYKGNDPEFGSPGFLPPLRVITAGIHINY